MPLYRLADELPTLTAPVIIAALDGWVDAAGAASAVVTHLSAGAQVIAEFDADALFEYRARRPVLDVVDGALRDLVWPGLALRHVMVGDRDLLVLAGAEPDLRWQQLAIDVRDLARDLGVAQWISLGAVPAAVPHTRAVPVMATASAEGLLRSGDVRGPTGILRVPSAALSVLELAASRGGIPAVGFFAQVPPYAGNGYATATLALIERLRRHLDVDIDAGELVAVARAEQVQLDTTLRSDPDGREMLERLEAMGLDEEPRIPTSEELASEIQRFLRDQRSPDEPDPPAFGG